MLETNDGSLAYEFRSRYQIEVLHICTAAASGLGHGIQGRACYDRRQRCAT